MIAIYMRKITSCLLTEEQVCTLVIWEQNRFWVWEMPVLEWPPEGPEVSAECVTASTYYWELFYIPLQ